MSAEQTKTRILDAAFREFAEHGLAGARVDRIAKSAERNKNLISETGSRTWSAASPARS
jgi:AcrR family transcriptional regulator